MHKRFGYSIEDLPEGALGFPEVVFEDLTEWEEFAEAVKRRIEDADNDDAGEQLRD